MLRYLRILGSALDGVLGVLGSTLDGTSGVLHSALGLLVCILGLVSEVLKISLNVKPALGISSWAAG